MRQALHNPALRSARVLVFAMLAVMAFAVGALAVLSIAPRSAAAQDSGADSSAPAVQYARVGVVPLRDEGNIRDGAEKLSEMLAARLDARFDDVEFVPVELDKDRADQGPLLLDEAVALGRKEGVDALLDGVFLGVDIVGGTWPNQGSDLPMARGMMRWRVVDCTSGLLAVDGKVMPKKPKCYPMRIRTEDELISSVMQDMVAAVGDALESAGILAGTEPPAPEEPPAAPEEQNEDAGETAEP